MSRTYKDRPDWVKKNDPAFRPYIQHDHSRGECIEETFEDMRREAGGQVDWKISNKHARRCNKRTYYTYYCTKENPHTGYFTRCWRWRDTTLWGGTRYLIECVGHVTYDLNPEEPCSCDRHPEPINHTCYITNPRSVGNGELYNNYTSRTKGINLFFTRPTRARVRDDMRGIINDYNTNGDLSDENEDYDGSWEKNIPWWDY